MKEENEGWLPQLQKKKINWRRYEITKNDGSSYSAKDGNVDDNIGIEKVT